MKKMSKELIEINKEIERLEEPIDKLRKKRNKIYLRKQKEEVKVAVGKYFQKGNWFFHPIKSRGTILYGIRIYRDNKELAISYTNETWFLLKGWKEIKRDKFNKELQKVLLKCGLA